MKKTLFIQYYESLLDTFTKYLHKVAEDAQTEDIHQLRVSIKKLRAIWTLTELVSDRKWKKKKHFALFNKLFSTAGKLREAQINQELIRNYSSRLEDYKLQLGMIEFKQLKKLKKRIKQFDQARLEDLNRTLIKKINTISDDYVLTIAKQHVSAFKLNTTGLEEDSDNNDQLHDIRIALKAIQEILFIIKKLGNSKDSEKKLKKIKVLNEAIGTWHDYDVLIDSLQKYHEENSEEVSSLIEQISTEQVARSMKLIRSIRKSPWY